MKQRDRNDVRRTTQLQPQRQNKSLKPIRVCISENSCMSSPLTVSSPDSPACFSGQLLSRGSPLTPVGMPSLVSHLYQPNALPSISAFQSPPPSSPPMPASLFDLNRPHHGPTLLNDRSAWANVCGWAITIGDPPADTTRVASPSPVESPMRNIAPPAFTPVLDKSRVARLRQGATRQRSNSADLFLDCVQMLSTKSEGSTASPSAMLLSDSEDVETSSRERIKAKLQHGTKFDSSHSQFPTPYQRDVSMWHY